MGVIHSYYRILGISSSANLAAISRAIKNMKERDTNGDFTATLNMIEQILRDPVQREQYDDSIDLPPSERADYKAQELEIFNQQRKKTTTTTRASTDFLDVPEIDIRRYQHQARMDSLRNTDHQEILKEENEKNLKYPFVFPWKKFFLILIVIGLSYLAYFYAKPLYFEYQTYKQAENALNDLFSARDAVVEYIRKNKVFPQDLSAEFTAHGNFYDIVLIDDKALKLTFNERAAKKLQGGSYLLETYEIPNTGINWRCSIDPTFPEKYKPPRCF